MARGTIRTPDEKLIGKLTTLAAPFQRKIAKLDEQKAEQVTLRDALLNAALVGSDEAKRNAYLEAAGIEVDHSAGIKHGLEDTE
jgi:hypothetical protein